MTLLNLSLLYSFGPALLGLLVALAVWAVRRSRSRSSGPLVAGGVRAWTLTGVLVALGIVLAQRALYLPGSPLVQSAGGPAERWFVMFTTPLIAGLLSVALLMVPIARRSGAGTADLSRRTLTSFGARWWFVTLAAVVVVVVLVAVITGLASSPDEQGRYTMYYVDLGSMTMGTSIYGWYHSVPSLVLTGLLLSIAVINVMLIARPPLAPDRQSDIAARRWRTRNVVTTTTAALLLHLSAVLGSLAGTAATRGSGSLGDGFYRGWPPFAVLEQPLWVAELIAELGGWFLWFTVLLAAVAAARSRTHE